VTTLALSPPYAIQIGVAFAGVATILVIEDDGGIRSAITRALTDLGHVVTATDRGMSGLESAVDNPPDVVLLDLGLPDIDGLQILTMLRAVSNVPVIIISARDDDADMIKALDSGADDYIVKPFGIEQANARLRAVLRRSGSAAAEGPLVVGGLTIDARTREVRLDGAEVDLSPKEFDLLLALAQRAGEVVTKRELLASVWRQNYGGSERTVDVHLSWLRRKLGETAADPRYLHSVRGVGVRLAAPDDTLGGE
jgi:two-component system response regulator PrrA